MSNTLSSSRYSTNQFQLWNLAIEFIIEIKKYLFNSLFNSLRLLFSLIFLLSDSFVLLKLFHSVRFEMFLCFLVFVLCFLSGYFQDFWRMKFEFHFDLCSFVKYAAFGRFGTIVHARDLILRIFLIVDVCILHLEWFSCCLHWCWRQQKMCERLLTKF